MFNVVLSVLALWRRDEKGATAIEYSLIAAGVSLAIVTAVFLFGDDLQHYFEVMGTVMEDQIIAPLEENNAAIP